MPFPYTFPFDFETEDFTVRIAFDSTPFAATPQWTHIDADVISGSIRVGRQHELDRVEAGMATLVVKNTNGNYWPDNTSSPYYGKLLPGKRINIRKVYNSVTYDLFTGFIESYKPGFISAAGVGPIITITAVDLFKNLALTDINDRVADFSGTNYLSMADHADLSMGNIDMAISAWVYLDSKSVNRPFVVKSDNSTNMEYMLFYNSSNDSFIFRISGDGTLPNIQQVTALYLGSPSTGTWYHIIAWHDSATSTLNISVNDGTVNSGTNSPANGIFNGTSEVKIGKALYLDATGTYNHDGRIASVGVWKRLLSAAERTTLYNLGRRPMYTALTSSLKTDLKAWWDLYEASGNRADSHTGGHTLTDNGSVGSVSEFPSERSDVRVGRVLDNVGWPTANRDLGVGAATLQALNPVIEINALTHLQAVQQSENGLIFIAGDGDVQFQNRTARANTPFDASQATFGDDAGEMPYHDVEFSYDDQFIYNDVRLTRTGGTEQVAGDIASVNTYGKRTLSRSGLLQSTDADVLTITQTLRDKYIAPSLRLESIIILPRRDLANLWPKVLNYGISTRITARLNEASLDSEFHIEGIEHRFRSGFWETKWQLSKAS